MPQKLWSKKELARLRKYAEDGLTSRVAALKLKRPHPATRYKAMRLGILFGGRR